jgi:hypothetical protein
MIRLTISIILFSVAVASQSQIILFPGDANKDGIANQFDLLPIGVAYGQEGIPRPGATLDWQPQFHPVSWPQNLPVSGINLAFQDSDGNGFVDSLDIDAIALHFDSTQNASQPPPMPYLLPDTCFSCPKPDLLITFDRDTALVNDTFFATLRLRYPPNVLPQFGALAIAFDLTYDPENIQDSLLRVFPDTMPGDLLFVAATSTLARTWRAVPDGAIGFGASGKGANAFFTPRQLGVVKIVVEDMVIRNLTTEAPFWFDASNLLIINENEQVVCPGNVETDTILLFDPASGAEETAVRALSVSVFPNPAGSVLHLRSPGAPMRRAEVFNPSGVLVLEKKMPPAGEAHIVLGGLPPGFYFVKISAESGQAVRKFWVK